MKLTRALLALAVLAGGLSAFADKSKSLHDQFTGQSYGMAGCGLGSVVFADKPGLIQVIGATLNGVSGNQTFGITSGTSNCGASGKAARANQFIEVNKVALENDLSRGTGESIVSLAEVMGCKNTNFAVEMKSKYQPGSSQEQLVSAADQSCQL